MAIHRHPRLHVLHDISMLCCSHALKLLLRQAFVLSSSVASSRRASCRDIRPCFRTTVTDRRYNALQICVRRGCWCRTFPCRAFPARSPSRAVMRYRLCLVDNEGPSNTRTRRTSPTGATFQPPQQHVATTDVVPAHRPVAYAAVLAAADRATMQAPRLLPFTMHSTVPYANTSGTPDLTARPSVLNAYCLKRLWCVWQDPRHWMALNASVARLSSRPTTRPHGWVHPLHFTSVLPRRSATRTEASMRHAHRGVFAGAGITLVVFFSRVVGARVVGAGALHVHGRAAARNYHDSELCSEC
ncbi:hypothetical protein VOLCADRAFT_87684 [Volvox carteri f. nagariensis]|uniref:Uncharacterized protein n=1 Tax=Volvox carteri f. nagariensis TaxID=3068 RepID=D8TLZ2_VOLCA|nr:uncharacterized protein VOLCADRAFT_87684 [Volvox carteri f. nagariensis]EFJ51417.1 hypothetical protein VOLCADRAFT_87684 [Volvox carteri f. nagariensis]|eukprot:XP_002947369.1 hypothetical protein VOLCADRAFT_87684 [Volvox carteri f. nagariensis]